jgi:hypothetical protein
LLNIRVKEILTAMLLWIGANTGYNVDLSHPQIQSVTQTELEELYSQGGGNASELHAFYDTVYDTIYLPDTFNIHDAWHKGVLMHELLHYVQDQNQTKFECTAEMEQDVWPLQQKYLLEVHGLTWNYDELWYKLTSNCQTN